MIRWTEYEVNLFIFIKVMYYVLAIKAYTPCNARQLHINK